VEALEDQPNALFGSVEQPISDRPVVSDNHFSARPLQTGGTVMAK